MNPNLVEPNAAAPAAAPKAPVEPTDENAAPAAPETKPAGATELPDDLLKIPAVQGLIAGEPPAFSVPIAEFQKLPEAKLLVANKEPLMQAGIATYRSLGGDTGVLFNQLYISSQEIQDADKAGQLQSIAPSFDAVNQQVATSGANHPALRHSGNVPTQFKTVNAPTPPQMASSASPLAPGAQKAMMKARTANMQPGSPTEGAVPAGGRLLNAVLKPVV
jgi:hypothetical protein